MEHVVDKIIRQFKTNCPFEIANGLRIHVRYANIGKTTRGIYYKKLRRRFIVIHNGLSEQWQRFVCAHELGHDRLHSGLHGYYFIEQNTLFHPGKMEREANTFAVKLLAGQEQPEEGETAEQFGTRIGIPVEMVRYL